MKMIVELLKIAAFALISACGNAGHINGHSTTTAHKSVNFIKEHLPDRQRVEFEVAYWAIRKHSKNDAEFLQVVDGKSAQDLIAQAKADFAEQKAAGIEEYARYDNWEQMLDEQFGIRKRQEPGAADTRDKRGYPRVDYKLHSM